MWQNTVKGGGGGGNSACGFVSGNITSSNQKVTLGFKPKGLMLSYTYNGTRAFTSLYDEDTDPNSFIRWETNTGSSTSLALPNTGYVGIESIDNDGFTINVYGGTFSNAYYVAY